MNGVEKRKFNQPVLIASIQQIKIGGEDKNVAFDVVRKFQLVRLTARHEKHTGRLNLIVIAVNHMKPGTFQQVQHLEKVVPVRVFHSKMPVGIEHFNLKLLTFSFRLAEVLQAVYRKLFARLPHKKVLSYCYESTNKMIKILNPVEHEFYNDRPTKTDDLACGTRLPSKVSCPLVRPVNSAVLCPEAPISKNKS